MLQTLVSLLREPDVSHVAVSFDSVIDARNQAEPTPAGQYALAADAARALGLVLWPMAKRYEVDDALATGALRYRDDPRVEQVVICSPDKDFAQCVVGQRVVCRDRIRKTVLDEGGVHTKFGVAPGSIPSYLALVGDPADGIPGIPGWGKKSAGIVLTHYGDLEAIPTLAQDWAVEVRGAARLAGSLAERRQEAILYRNLATLKTDVPLPHTLDELAWAGPDRRTLERFTERIGEAVVLERIPRWREPEL